MNTGNGHEFTIITRKQGKMPRNRVGACHIIANLQATAFTSIFVLAIPVIKSMYRQ